jgi:hypothetical protein
MRYLRYQHLTHAFYTHQYSNKQIIVLDTKNFVDITDIGAPIFTYENGLPVIRGLVFQTDSPDELPEYNYHRASDVRSYLEFIKEVTGIRIRN